MHIVLDCGRQRDVVFMLDSSGSVEETFELQLRLTREIIYGLNFAGSRTRVGVVQWSDSPARRFNLNEYSDRESVLNSIAYLQVRTGSIYLYMNAEKHLCSHAQPFVQYFYAYVYAYVW